MSTDEASEPSDAELLRRHVAGDAQAFGMLFARHRNRLWAVALRTMGDPSDAEDGLQDALVSAYRRAGTFRGDSAVTTWLHRVVVNACLDRIRAGKVRATDPLPEQLDEAVADGTVTGSPAPDPETVALATERRDAVLAALAQLPVEQRAALVLVDMEGYSVAEAAAILDCAVGTVKSRCARGRTRLAGLLGWLRPGSPAVPGNRTGVEPVPSSDPVRGPPVEPTHQ